MKKWQKITLTTLGSSVIITILLTLQLSGAKIQYSPNMQCSIDCETYINITTKKGFCFEKKMIQPNNFKMQYLSKKFCYGYNGFSVCFDWNETILVAEQIINNTLIKPKEVLASEYYPATYTWEDIEEGQCFNNSNKKLQFRLVGSKLPHETIKWSFKTEDIDIDPIFLPQVNMSNNNFVFNVSDDFVKINLSLPITFSGYTFNYSYHHNGYYPSFEYIVPNSAQAVILTGTIFTVNYIVDFGYLNVTNNLYSDRIVLKGGNYTYYPRFFCSVNSNKISSSSISRKLLDYNKIEYDVTYTLKDTDINGIYVNIPINSGTRIVCEDEVLPLQDALKFNGLLFWHDIVTNVSVERWNASGYFMSNDTLVVNGTSYSSNLNYLTFSDYSRVEDIGVVTMQNAQGRDPMYIVINTTNQSIVNNLTIEIGTAVNGIKYISAMFWNNSREGFLVYDNASLTIIPNVINLMRYNSTIRDFGKVLALNYTQPVDGVGAGSGFELYQKRNSNQTAILFANDVVSQVGLNDSVGLIIFDNNNLSIYNWSNPDIAFTYSFRAPSSRPAGSWTYDDSYFFILQANESLGNLTEGNLTMWLYNSSNNSINGYYNIDKNNSGVPRNTKACPIWNQSNKVAVISQFINNSLSSPSVGAFILDINGTIESNYPLQEASTEFAGTTLGFDNTFCLSEESVCGDVFFGWVGLDRLTFKMATYNSCNRTWSTNDMRQSWETPTICGDDCESIYVTKCPEPDCWMITTLDLLSDITSGMFINGTNLSIAYKKTIEDSMATTSGNGATFMFRGNLSFSAPLQIQATDIFTCAPTALSNWTIDDGCYLNTTINLKSNNTGIRIISGGGQKINRNGLSANKNCIITMGNLTINNGKLICG